jgi:hypothetical protein
MRDRKIPAARAPYNRGRQPRGEREGVDKAVASFEKIRRAAAKEQPAPDPAPDLRWNLPRSGSVHLN